MNSNLKGYYTQTWEWTGVTWTQVQPAASPWTVSLEAATYDQARQQMVVFGGEDWQNAYEDDTWVLSP